MKSCFQYYNSSKLLKEVDELIIRYNDQEDEQLIDFLKEHQHQRVILDIVETNDFIQSYSWRKLNAIKTRFLDYNFVVRFRVEENCRQIPNELLKIIRMLNIPYFFNWYVTTWDQLHYLIKLKVSDVYIVEDMGFELPKVKELCNKNKINIRAFPNIAQSSVIDSPAQTKFFIRPEDLDFYSQYIDIVEFWGDPLRQDVIYHVYFKSKKWLGDLGMIVTDLNVPFNNSGILSIFAQIRSNCGKKCLRDGKCSICFKLDSLSNTLKDKGFILKSKENN